MGAEFTSVLRLVLNPYGGSRSQETWAISPLSQKQPRCLSTPWHWKEKALPCARRAGAGSAWEELDKAAVVDLQVLRCLASPFSPACSKGFYSCSA